MIICILNVISANNNAYALFENNTNLIKAYGVINIEVARQSQLYIDHTRHRVCQV